MRPGSGVRVTLVLARIDDEPVVLVEEVPAQEPHVRGVGLALSARGGGPRRLPRDGRDASRWLGTDLWGSTLVDFGDEPLPAPILGRGRASRHATGSQRTAAPSPTTRSAPVSQQRDPYPAATAAAGDRPNALPDPTVSVGGIAREWRFCVDGAEVGFRRSSAPFTATLDMGDRSPPRIEIDRSGLRIATTARWVDTRFWSTTRLESLFRVQHRELSGRRRRRRHRWTCVARVSIPTRHQELGSRRVLLERPTRSDPARAGSVRGRS